MLTDRLITHHGGNRVPRLACTQAVSIARKAAVLMLLLWYGLCTETAAGLSEHIVETVLPNGLKVILLENHKAPVVTFQVWYRVGSRNEAWGKTGLSHMLEHMMFKGTTQVGPEAFSRIIQRQGGMTN